LTPRRKVFGIGFHKTATTSLATALRSLGYRVTGPNGVRDPSIARSARPLAFRLAERFDAFQDNPWPILYGDLDERFPGSRFVLTVRQSDEWIRSVVRHFGAESTPMREWIYGVGAPLGNEVTYLARYEGHNQAVREHFRERPEALLVMRITAGDGWERLCPFLGEAVPDMPFPHVNAAAVRDPADGSSDPSD